MSPRSIGLAIAMLLATACTTLEQQAAGDEIRYGKVMTTEAMAGPGMGLQRVVVKMPDGSVVDVTQERDSAILVGDVVRVFGNGSKVRVARL
jgi:hypothetical protein